MRGTSLLPVTALVLLANAACSSSTSPDGTGHVTVQLATQGTGATTAPASGPGGAITRGADVLLVTSVQLVARRIKLEQSGGNCPAPDLSDAGEGDDEDTEDCPIAKLGPTLLTPPLTDGAVTTFSLDIPAGTYHEVQLQIHKPTNHTSDAAFLAANPTFAGVSIKVVGTFNGTPFTFTTDITSEVEVEFESPLVVEADASTAFTLLFDVGSWFLNGAGTALINPTGLSVQNRSLIEQNIRQSFHAFEDENHDGHEG